MKLSMPGGGEDSLAAMSVQGTAQARETGAAQRHTRRAALIDAAGALSETPWPAVEEEALASRMISVLFGTEGQDRDGYSREEALQVYVADLTSTGADPVARLVGHADTTLAAARNVAEYGRLASTAITPDTDDIIVLEQAIGDIRFFRDMYLAAIKRLEAQGYTVPAGQPGEIRAAFSQTIRDVSATADLVAQHAEAAENVSRLAVSGGDLD